MSAASAGVISGVAARPRISIGQSLRRAGKPACISDAAARAIARACGSAGHTLPGPAHSAIHSVIARLSQMVCPSHSSSGTLAVGLISFSFAFVSGKSSGTITSSTGRPTWRATSSGRIDQLE
tara:strand:- start:1180 stop:1548 length:369 start_codon:yes stop_codon:yes gene_type:complete